MSIDIIDTNSHGFAMTTLADTVDRILAEHRLGGIDRPSLSPKRGRNLSCLLTTTEGNTLFVKRANGDDQFKASVAAGEFLLQRPGIADRVLFRAPRLIAASKTDNILIFEGVSNADGLATVLHDDILDDEQLLQLMGRIGEGLREVHEQPVNTGDVNDEPSPFPVLSHFQQLPWISFESFSAASLQVWGTLQRDTELYRAVVSLREMENTGAQVPIHGDLRFDQFLLDDDRGMWLIDWEEFRFGHRGRDLGSLIGEWLHIAFSTLTGGPSPTPAVRHSPQTTFDQEITHDEIVAHGQEALNTVLPRISALWRSYLGQDTRAEDIPELAAVSAAFAGWHLYDRLLATSELVPRVSALSWAAAGIGRNILLNPADAAKGLGLTAHHGPDSAPATHPGSRAKTEAKKI